MIPDPAAEQAAAPDEIRPTSIRRLPNIGPRHIGIRHIRIHDRWDCPPAPQWDFPADSPYPGMSEVGRLAEACLSGTTVPRTKTPIT